MMGPGIALTLALGGVRATLLSRSAEGAERGLEQARRQARVLTDNELGAPADIACALDSIATSTDFEASIGGADLVIESGPEDLTWKQDLFARMDAAARPDAVLASNTSGLSITAIAARCTRPERVLTTHFWNPPHLMPLVEIVQGRKTSPEAVEAVRQLLAGCGKTPVVVKIDRPGQLGNRLQMALVREAARRGSRMRKRSIRWRRTASACVCQLTESSSTRTWRGSIWG
jgi:3-hydroxybutyryl-CoA dehydrogenase